MKKLILITMIVSFINIQALSKRTVKAISFGAVPGAMVVPVGISCLNWLDKGPKITKNELKTMALFGAVCCGFFSWLCHKYLDKEYVLGGLSVLINNQEEESSAEQTVKSLVTDYQARQQKREAALNLIIQNKKNDLECVLALDNRLNEYLDEDIIRYADFPHNRVSDELSYKVRLIARLINRLQSLDESADQEFHQRCEVEIQKARYIIKELNELLAFLNEHQSVMIYDDLCGSLYPLFKKNAFKN